MNMTEEELQNLLKSNPDLRVQGRIVPPKVVKPSVGHPRGKYKVSEADFQKIVIAFAHLQGWTIAHFRGAWSKDGKRFLTPVQGDGKGFPDLVLVRERVVWAELKSEKGRMSEEQEEWKTKLFNAGQEVYVWKPSELESVKKILRKV